MPNKPIFFSYSRADGEFVLKLAKDLRKAGADIWLDQLDIKAGSRWDSSIEAALNNSLQIIVVLSPTSVASNNVMDEVSFALESNKTVIPVLLTECTIPFRIRRLQQVNFTGEYEASLNQLLSQLGYAAADGENPGITNGQPQLTAVAEVFYSDQANSKKGSFTLKNSKNWMEQNADGLFHWKEINREDKRIHLNDPGRYDCILDLESSEVILSEDGGKSWFVLYYITDYR